MGEENKNLICTTSLRFLKTYIDFSSASTSKRCRVFAILRSPADLPWRPAWQPAASKLMLRTPGVGQDKQGAWRWPVGAWQDLPAFVHLSVQFGLEQGPS
eukprot:1162114-Pelagomonas_calceolata.AAC.5